MSFPPLSCVPSCVSRSVVSDSLTQWTVARQAPPSMGFSRHEHWSGLPLSSPGDLPNRGMKPRSPTLQVDSLPSKPPGKLLKGFSCITVYKFYNFTFHISVFDLPVSMFIVMSVCFFLGPFLYLVFMLSCGYFVVLSKFYNQPVMFQILLRYLLELF